MSKHCVAACVVFSLSECSHLIPVALRSSYSLLLSVITFNYEILFLATILISHIRPYPTRTFNPP